MKVPSQEAGAVLLLTVAKKVGRGLETHCEFCFTLKYFSLSNDTTCVVC